MLPYSITWEGFPWHTQTQLSVQIWSNSSLLCQTPEAGQLGLFHIFKQHEMNITELFWVTCWQSLFPQGQLSQRQPLAPVQFLWCNWQFYWVAGGGSPSPPADLAKSDTAKGLDRTSRGQLGPAGQAAGLSFSASHRGVVVPMAALQLEGAAPALFLSRAPGWWGAENLGLGGGHSLWAWVRGSQWPVFIFIFVLWGM